MEPLEHLPESWASHSLGSAVVFVLVRAATVVVPPVPGPLVDLPAIAIFGWWPAFVYAELGIMLGSAVAFGLARQFREPLALRFVRLRDIAHWEAKLTERQKLWAIAGMRLVAIPVFDYVNYAAGLTTVRFSTFMLATFLGNVPYVFTTFYLGGMAHAAGWYYLAAFGALLLIGLTLLRKRTKT